MDVESILTILTEEDGLEQAYLKTAKFYANSGRTEKAKNMCHKTLELNSENEEAKILLESLE